jgi:hypothetical protein
METMASMIDSFDWHKAPFNSIYLVACTSLLYVLFVLLHISFADFRAIFLFKGVKVLVPAHNLVLFLVSLWIFIGCSYEVIARSMKEGSVDWLFCEHSTTKATGALFFYSYIYYMSKYYELFDTFLQLFAGNTPPNYFLHVYHHSLVIFMSWIWLEQVSSLQFIGLLFNVAVHVVMYYYFFLKSLGVNPWWKKAVTTFQIIQFMTSLVAVGVTMYYAWSRHNDASEDVQQCKGFAVVIGQVVFNITLLYGFFGVLSKGKKSIKSK